MQTCDYRLFLYNASRRYFRDSVTIDRVKWRPSNIWSPNDRHFVGITWHNVCSSGGEDLSFYLNGIESVGKKMLYKTYLSDIASNKHYSEFYPQHGGKNQPA